MAPTRPIRAFASFAALFAIGVVPSLCFAEDAAPPRYRLPVGRVLTYTMESKSKGPDGHAKREASGTTRATVVAQNPDGSSRVIIETSTSYGNGGGPERTSMGMFDVSPDGKATSASGFSPRVSTERVFPLLPADAAQASAGWKSPVGWDSSVTTFTANPSSDPNVFTFLGVEDGPVSKIYVTTSKRTTSFDREKGSVTEIVGESSQDWGFKQTSFSTTRLTKDETIDPAQAAALGKDYGVFFETQKKRGELLSRIREEPERAEKLVAEADALTAEAAKRVTTPDVVKHFEKTLNESSQNAKYSIDEGQRIAKFLNKPAADWSSTDLDGHSFSADKLKGKVVVMDFWYRGCGWCMFAMPQVKQLASDYKDRGVVVLGMNTDEEEEDAKFVVKTLGLTYPQIKAQGLPEKFGVRGFPTLVVIDQAGVVRGIHVGYSADLRESVGKQIDALLAKDPA